MEIPQGCLTFVGKHFSFVSVIFSCGLDPTKAFLSDRRRRRKREPRMQSFWSADANGDVAKSIWSLAKRKDYGDRNMTILRVTKEDRGTYVCTVKNLLGEKSAFSVVTVIDRLRFTITPPIKVVAFQSTSLILNCKAQGALEITWKRANKYPPQNHTIFSNGTLFVKKVTTNDAGSYTCVAKNYQRTITASSTVEVLKRVSCSSIKSGRSGSSSGNYIIDPDGKGGVAPFSVYCDMSDKGGVGVTVISHDSERRTYVGNIPGCEWNKPGCYRKDVTYNGVNIAQLSALTRISRNCEQFIKFECYNDVSFVQVSVAWWVSRDRRKMNYWGGAGGSPAKNVCACSTKNDT